MPKFMGEPRPELDEAWHELLAGTMMRFSDEEMLLAGNATSIRHKDGGFVGGLGVSHSLHCVVCSLSLSLPLFFVFWFASHPKHSLSSLFAT